MSHQHWLCLLAGALFILDAGCHTYKDLDIDEKQIGMFGNLILGIVFLLGAIPK